MLSAIIIRARHGLGERNAVVSARPSNRINVALGPLRILFVTPECAPLVKTGGLGDVAGALPAALRRLGLDVRVLMPGYRGARCAAGAPERHGSPPRAASRRARCSRPSCPRRAGIVVDCPDLYDRDGGPYQDADGATGPTTRCASDCCRARSRLAQRRARRLARRVVHCNDWQTGLAPAYPRSPMAARAASVITIHNLAFQGIFAPHCGRRARAAARRASPSTASSTTADVVPQGGIFYADAITTVSPTYAHEIQAEAIGMGLHGLLAGARDADGILNGIDTTVWNPATDASSRARYDADDAGGQGARTSARCSCAAADRWPTCRCSGVVRRLTEQKGIDLLADIVRRVLALPAQLVVSARATGPGDIACRARGRAPRAWHAASASTKRWRTRRSRRRYLPDAVAVRAVRDEPDVQPALRHAADRSRNGRVGRFGRRLRTANARQRHRDRLHVLRADGRGTRRRRSSAAAPFSRRDGLARFAAERHGARFRLERRGARIRSRL